MATRVRCSRHNERFYRQVKTRKRAYTASPCHNDIDTTRPLVLRPTQSPAIPRMLLTPIVTTVQEKRPPSLLSRGNGNLLPKAPKECVLLGRVCVQQSASRTLSLPRPSDTSMIWGKRPQVASKSPGPSIWRDLHSTYFSWASLAFISRHSHPSLYSHELHVVSTVPQG